jgi:REP element-mobilizing transposase RayT
MGIKNKISPGYMYFITLTVIDWVDVFTRPDYKYIIIDSLEYCQKNKGLKIYAWCLMSNHLHLIAGTVNEESLSDILRDFKKFTNKKILEKIKEIPESRREWMLNRFEFAGRFDKKIKEYKFWQNGNEAKEIHTNDFLDQKLDYIHNNPVRAEIVYEPQDYKYSSAIDYCDGKGLLSIEKIE